MKKRFCLLCLSLLIAPLTIHSMDFFLLMAAYGLEEEDEQNKPDLPLAAEIGKRVRIVVKWMGKVINLEAAIELLQGQIEG